MIGPCAALTLALTLGFACGDDSEADGPSQETDEGTTTAASSGEDGTTSAADSSTSADSSTGEPEPAGPKSLVIAIDGLRADALALAATPNMDGLIDGSWQESYAGAYAADAQCLTDADSYSGPNHWAIMTGAIGEQHGVVGNLDVESGDGEAFPHYLSLLERANPELATAYLFTWSEDLKIPCEADYIRDDEDEPNVQRIVDMLEQTFADENGELQTQWAADTVPDAIFLFLDDTDYAGHLDGFDPLVPEYLAEIEEIDAQLGRIFDALAARPNFANESWQIVITTDHGGLGLGHGGFSPEELTIPFLVASEDVAQGPLPPGTDDNGTRNFDTVPTVLEHMGVETPAVLTGLSRALGAP